MIITIRSIVARGNVNYNAIPRSNKTIIRNFFGLIVNGVKNTAPNVEIKTGGGLIIPAGEFGQMTINPDEEIQFLHGPTDTFESVGIQADPLPVSGSSGFPTLFRLSASNQSYTAQGTVRIRVSVKLEQPFQSGSVDSQILAKFESLGVLKKQVRRNINFTSADPIGTTKSTDIVTTVSDPEIVRISYKIEDVGGLARSSLAGAIEREKVIPPDENGNGNGNGNGQGTGRLEGFVTIEDNHKVSFVLTESTLTILRNRFNELRLKALEVTNFSSELGTIPINILLDQIRQHNLQHGDDPPPIGGKGIFDQISFETLIIGGLAVAALMPRGDKKK